VKEKRLVRRAQAAMARLPAAIFGGNRCNRNSAGVAFAVVVVAEAPGGVYLGKIGLKGFLSGLPGFDDRV
jgi:hypothetical protein